MPRKKAVKSTPKPKGKRKASAPAGVSFIPLNTAWKLVNIRADDRVWDDVRGAKKWKVKDALVKLMPPAHATDEDIAYARQAAEKAGARAVIDLPREPGGKPSVAEQTATEVQTKPTRQVVLDMVDAATNSHDKAALREFVEDVMSEEGL